MLFADLETVTLRMRTSRQPGLLGKITTAIGSHGAYIGEINSIVLGMEFTVRDIEVFLNKETDTLEKILNDLRILDGTEVIEVRDVALNYHEGGKLDIVPRYIVSKESELRQVYTPGVASVCKLIYDVPSLANRYTCMKNTVAVVTNGTRVLGLGNIGTVASLPVMEGKAALMKQFTGLNAIPILINSSDPNIFVETVKLISSGFGGIHLEDIEAPCCYKIEERLINELDIPVMHDDQHGTATVVLAAAINAAKKAKREMKKLEFGFIGLGAAGSAIARLIMLYTNKPVYGEDLNEEALNRFVSFGGLPGDLDFIMKHSDVIVCSTGKPGLISPCMIKKGQIIFALTNPVPEIDRDEAVSAGASMCFDGSTINNILAYPGIFNGAIRIRAKKIADNMKIAAAEAIASVSTPEELVPSPLNKEVHQAVTKAVIKSAIKDGIAVTDEWKEEIHCS